MGKYEIIESKKKKIKRIVVLIISIFIVFLSVFFGIYYFLSLESESKIIEENLIKKDKDKNLVSEEEKEKNKEENTTNVKKQVIDIKGQVLKPGTYEVEEGTRVIDCINIAGGLTKNADTSLINLSKKVYDEMVIIVNSKEEVLKSKEDDKKLEKYLPNDASVNEEKIDTTTNVININKATLSELTVLNGIGESKAQDIINYRNEVGSFKTIEEIMNVPGIGENLFAKIKENITV